MTYDEHTGYEGTTRSRNGHENVRLGARDRPSPVSRRTGNHDRRTRGLERFSETKVWIFDLDHTLYPADCDPFAQVDRRMGAFIAAALDIPARQARRLQKAYWRDYGTTLAGLMAVHGVEPDAFLDYVYDIDLSMIPRAPTLGAAIGRLAGKKYIFTNSSRGHAENVARRLGILGHFDAVFDVADADYVPKPDPLTYATFLERHAVGPRAAVMFDDLVNNLKVPAALGMATVLVRSGPCDASAPEKAPLPAHVHHVTRDLEGFLGQVHQAHGRERVSPVSSRTLPRAHSCPL